MEVTMRYDGDAVAVALQATVSSSVMPRAARLTLACWLSSAACLAPTPAHAADLQPRTVQAYEKYADQATRDFVARARKTAAGATRCDGVIAARAAGGDGILTVPGGLVHHWLGLAFVKGAQLKQVDGVARDYSSYSKVYKSVVSSKVLDQKGNDYRVLIRLKEDAGLTAVLDVRSAVDYRAQSDGSVTAISRSEEIRQVEDYDKPTESLLPVGRDSGYLWRAHTFTHFVPEKDGVLIVMETLGLSRRFPYGTGWFLEPIARRIGRKSVEESLTEFGVAIRRSAGLPAPGSSCN
jgi:hypothetical protein